MDHKLITLALFVGILLYAHPNDLNNKIFKTECTNGDKQRVCISKGCVQAAFDILKTIDESIDPCDDFYEFACGSYIKNTVIPDDDLFVAKHKEINKEIFDQLHSIVEEPIQPSEPRPFVMLKNFYKICMDVDALEKNGLSNFKKILEELGGWPVLEGPKWDDTQFDWKELVYKFQNMSLPSTGFMRMNFGVDAYNPSQNIITFGEGAILLEKQYLVGGFNSSIVQAFYNYSVDYAIIYGADPEFAKKEMKDVIEFEIEFSQIMLDREDRRNMTTLTNQMSVADLQKQFPYFPWLEFINNVLAHPNLTITAQEIVDVNVPSFIPKMEELVNRTPKRVQANFLIFQVLERLSTLQPKKIRDLDFVSIKAFTGIEQQPPKWEECTIAASNRLGIAMAALYVRKYFNEKSKKNIIEMISDIKTAFVEDLRSLDWMDSITREEAIKKVGNMINHVAYPNELLDDSKIEDYYALLEPADTYLNFHLNHQKFLKNYNIETFRKPVSKTDWRLHSSSTTVNAFYRPSENSIELPAGILQNVYFNNDRPQYLNYGGIGFIIGHEITHGFDDEGRQVDKDGLLVDWWTNETEETFINKTKCIIEQYSNFLLPNSNATVNGVVTQGENIADNGGLKVAYLAYQSWIKRKGVEAGLPGLKYTPNQLFWISVANIWCTKERPITIDKSLLIAHHSPSNLRVTGPIRNSQYFADDFHCPVNSKMNPAKKCSVW